MKNSRFYPSPRRPGPSGKPAFTSDYRAKERVFGLIGESESRVYPHVEMTAKAAQWVIHDTLDSRPIVVVWDARARMAQAFSARVGESVLTFKIE